MSNADQYAINLAAVVFQSWAPLAKSVSCSFRGTNRLVLICFLPDPSVCCFHDSDEPCLVIQRMITCLKWKKHPIMCTCGKYAFNALIIAASKSMVT